MKPATIQDYGYLLAEPDSPHRRGPGRSAGRIMRAFGDRRTAKVTTAEVASFLRGLEREGMSARSVNKQRELLGAMFTYAQREDTYALERNPVSATSKRRMAPPAVLDFFEPEEVEAAAAGAQRGRQPQLGDEGEAQWRAWEDRQDAELYRVAAYTGMRLGELLALRWGDVDLDRRRVIVHRAVSAGVEGPTKSRQARALPLADVAAAALARLAARGDYTGREDYVFCSRLGRRLDRSAVRRRYTRARDAAGLRALRFHALRHQQARSSRARPVRTSCRPSSGTRGSAPPSATCTRRAARRMWRRSTGRSPRRLVRFPRSRSSVYAWIVSPKDKRQLAREHLEAAQAAVMAGRVNDAVNALFYAAEAAVVAIADRHEIDTKKHHGLKADAATVLYKRGALESDFGAVLRVLNQARKDIWYEGEEPQLDGGLEDLLADVEELVEAAEESE